jgi:hypothetical protein
VHTDRDARRTARFADLLSVGSSIALTANMLRDRVIRTAVVDPGSPLNGVRPDDVTGTERRMYLRTDPARGETYQDLLRRRGLQTLDAHQTYTPDNANKIQHGVRQRMVDVHSRRWIRSFDLHATVQALHHQLASAIPTGVDGGSIRRRPGRPLLSSGVQAVEPPRRCLDG